MNRTDTHDPDDNALAAEYALHLLSPSERAAFEARMREDAILRDLVVAWDQHFVELSDDFAPVAPPSHVKSSIDRRLFGSQTGKGAATSVLRWLIGGGAFAAALGVAIFVFMPMLYDPMSIDPTHRAEITAEDRSLIVTVEFSSNDGVLIVQRLSASPAPGRDHEMWLISEGATIPISLGVIPSGQSARIDIPDALRDRLNNALLAVSDEPKGGSPTGQPTGAVLAAGPIQTL